MRSDHGLAAVDLGVAKAGSVDAGLHIGSSGTIRRGAPSKNRNIRTWAPIQSGYVWVQLASALLKLEAHRTAAKIRAPGPPPHWSDR